MRNWLLNIVYWSTTAQTMKEFCYTWQGTEPALMKFLDDTMVNGLHTPKEIGEVSPYWRKDCDGLRTSPWLIFQIWYKDMGPVTGPNPRRRE